MTVDSLWAEGNRQRATIAKLLKLDRLWAEKYAALERERAALEQAWAAARELLAVHIKITDNLQAEYNAFQEEVYERSKNVGGV